MFYFQLLELGEVDRALVADDPSVLDDVDEENKLAKDAGQAIEEERKSE